MKLALKIGKVDLKDINRNTGPIDNSFDKAISRRATERKRRVLENLACEFDRSISKALSKAARGGSTTIVQILLDAGADINKGWTLAAAAGAGGPKMVRFLLDRGASPYGVKGLYAVNAAAKGGWASVVEILCDGGVTVARIAKEESYLNLMRAAMRRGHDHVVELLLQKGAASIDRSSVFPGEHSAVEDLLDKEVFLHEYQPVVLH